MRAPWRRNRRTIGSRRTVALGTVAVLTTGAAVVVEYGRVWRRGEAHALAETEEPLLAAASAAAQTAAVARSGYRETSPRENALFNLLSSFVITFGVTRAITFVLRGRGRWGPFRNVKVGRRHIHHFIPGIALVFVSGSVAIVTRDENIERWLALVFGSGMGLTMDESALLIELDDVYWTEEGIVSVQLTLAVTALLAALALGHRFVRRGEAAVLAPPAG